MIKLMAMLSIVTILVVSINYFLNIKKVNKEIVMISLSNSLLSYEDSHVFTKQFVGMVNELFSTDILTGTVKVDYSIYRDGTIIYTINVHTSLIEYLRTKTKLAGMLNFYGTGVYTND
jgi:hypothetical protein